MAYVVEISILVTVVVLAIMMQLEVDYEPLIVKKSVVVQATDVELFKFIADVPNYNKWINFITEVNEIDESRMGVGKAFNMYIHYPFIGNVQYRADITNYSQPRSLAFDADFELLLPRIILEISEGSRPGVSKLTWQMFSKRRSYLFCSTALPISRFIIGKQLQGALFRLKLEVSHL